MRAFLAYNEFNHNVLNIQIVTGIEGTSGKLVLC